MTSNKMDDRAESKTKTDAAGQIRWKTALGDTRTLSVPAGAGLLDLCRQYHIPLGAECNGNGTCGKCRVQVLQGDAPAAEEDRRVFSAQELMAGYRLACRLHMAEGMLVRIPGSRSLGQEIQVPGLDAGQPSCTIVSGAGDTRAGYRIAVDLGSTTLAAALLDAGGKVLAQASAANSQRIYGADVISRIHASNGGKQGDLQACICRDLEQLFQSLVQKSHLDSHHEYEKEAEVTQIAIAGNTTMLHLLRGYSCEGLGQVPFLPVELGLECLDFEELFLGPVRCRKAKVYLLPGMSAFLGADITAGLYSSGFWQGPGPKPACFVDLGTNGEMACGNRNGFVTASAAAGPALEGGHLSSGVPGIPGAISKVSYLYHRIRIQTIGQKRPCGLCGTGALEAVAALLREGLLDERGLLASELFEDGLELARQEDGTPIRLTQADIREIQMAKAAIRAGIGILLRRYGQMTGIPVSAGQVPRVFLAGGFGYYLDPDTAIEVGLFPAEWKGKVVSCGNTSLKGAVAFLTDSACREELLCICEKNKTIRLEEDPDFQELYIQAMDFHKEEEKV